jgi:lipopolysaccharide/colanic/teichoic acid biosynthesis glycosyltransferase
MKRPGLSPTVGTRELVLNKMLGLKPNLPREDRRSSLPEETAGLGMLPESLFMKLLCLERKRTERSGRRFVLLLLDTGSLFAGPSKRFLPDLIAAIDESTRDTDLKGWYKSGSVIGVIFTEIGDDEENVIVRSLSAKLTSALYDRLGIREINQIKLSFHVFPEDWDDDDPGGPVTTTLYAELARDLNRKKGSLAAKRAMDILGSVVGLLLALPLMMLIALAIKLTSKGPVFFRQVRLAQHGRKFTFLKFRSMYLNNNSKIHEDYVKSLIHDADGIEQAGEDGNKLYKLTADPRITPIGHLLRSTSLDELPQFLNVLWGDMSLVGPRPPVIYEFEQYNLWHRQRLLALKPGITGLWQVYGRSRVKFDEMVRLDIRYARTWSLWLDIKILLRTPSAVLSGNGAC